MKNKGFYILIIFFTTAFAFSCRSDRSKAQHDSTTRLCNSGLFVEGYKIFNSGAYGGDRVSDYLTDSTNFRMYIGTYDNADGGYSFICKGDSVYIYKVEQHSPKNKILDIKTYSISELKKRGKFE